MNQENNSGMNEMDKAMQLRKEAEFLEYKGRVKARIVQLQSISEDPQYDKYLAQLLRDLENGKATPNQVERETERSYGVYRQRMSTQRCAIKPTVKPATTAQSAIHSGNTFEFRIGANILSVIGAMFVLIAFVIFAFNFLNGLGQGICLYIAALALVLLSELLMSRKVPVFAHIITGIGVGGLYAANIANYTVLNTINSLAAIIITLLIAAATIFISRKNDSTVIRLISLLGCYICFYPINAASSDLLQFLIITFTLLIINVVGVLFQNHRNQLVINGLHLMMHLIFSIIFIGMSGSAGVSSEYLVLYIISSYIFINVLALQQNRTGNNTMFILCTIGNSICIFTLFVVGTVSTLRDFPEKALFVHLVAEILMIVVSAVVFVLWKKEDGRKWAQLYYVAAVILLLSSFSEYEIEMAVGVLTVFVFVQLFTGKRELIVLDCIVTFWTGVIGIATTGMDASWICWIFVAALVLALSRIKQLYIFYELLITLSVIFITGGYFHSFLLPKYVWMEGWQYPISVLIILLLMLVCNHLPWLKNKSHRPYNISMIGIIALYCLGVYTCENYLISTAMMVIGAVTIIVVFRPRYGLEIHRKYLLLAGFLTWFALTSHYESPVVVSILLMVIALSCVGIGFKLQDKAERICGLVMAIFVCLKLVVYDFREVDTLYRVIVFLTVGIIALMISFIYIQLEKRADKQKKDMEVTE